MIGSDSRLWGKSYMSNKQGRTCKPRHALGVILLLLVSLVPITEDSIARAESESTDLTALERQVHELVNNHRTAIGLAPLAYSKEVAASARQHSRDIATGYVGFGHEGAEMRSKSLSRTMSFSQFAENVGANNYSRSAAPRTAVAEWLQSSGHRMNIEGNFDVTGVGIVHAGDTFFFTQIFLLTHDSPRPPAEVDRADALSPKRERDPSDPRTRAGRKRVRGGWVQEIDPAR
ncbi:MAG TPA: CAP domain-containing protein [Candidatus Binatia bacterium]|nr:CAP domain-containing protein [Candidatus Binatia bacterium]